MLIAEEDNRFYEHSGVNFTQYFRRRSRNPGRSYPSRGQHGYPAVGKNVFDLRDRTYDRKILEVFLAMRLERFVPKKKIMELYLDRVYFGGGL